MATDPKLDPLVDAEAGEHDLFYIRTSSGHTNDERGLVLKEGEKGPTDLAPGQQPNPAIYKSTYVPMDQAFTSNLRDTDGYLQLGVGVSTFYDQKVTDHLKDNEMAVRSAVLEVLAQQSAEALNTPQGKAALRQQLKVAINNVLVKREGFGGVDDVYFTSFIIQ